ncbi:hypothetical protein N0V86_009418 [Didymella sp. IMI 355093]|nr:hypothetical protein N0V86_009418 [Didymella sp. IMI 355093]
MSPSPVSKRNSKPSPTAPAQSLATQYTAVNEQPILQPAAPTTQTNSEVSMSAQPTQSLPSGHRKRKSASLGQQASNMADTGAGAEAQNSAASVQAERVDASAQEPKIKKSRTNTPWTPAEELRLKQMRDAGNSWSEIAKVGKNNERMSLFPR